MSEWLQGGRGLDESAEEPSTPRTLLKCAWRCSRSKPRLASVEALMRATPQVRWAFHLSEAEHRRCCEEALRRGEPALAWDLFWLETHFSASGSSPGGAR